MAQQITHESVTKDTRLAIEKSTKSLSFNRVKDT